MIEEFLRCNYMSEVREESVGAFEEYIIMDGYYEGIGYIRPSILFIESINDGIIVTQYGNSVITDHYKTICPFILHEIVMHLKTQDPTEYIIN